MSNHIESAAFFMKDCAHFVTWMVKNQSATWSCCFPNDIPPFDFRKIFGHAENGIFRSTNCFGIYYDGYHVTNVMIEPDTDPLDVKTVESPVGIASVSGPTAKATKAGRFARNRSF